MAHRLASAAADRIVVIGNAGGGKSTLARKLAAARKLAYVEVDRFLWRQDWQLADPESYAAAHDRALSGPGWVIDGLGRRESIEARLDRSTDIILVDLPLWVHFWLAAERQIAWSRGRIEHAPAGAGTPPPTEALFRTIWDVDQSWMPEIRDLVDRAEAEQAKAVLRIETLEQLNALCTQIASWS